MRDGGAQRLILDDRRGAGGVGDQMKIGNNLEVPVGVGRLEVFRSGARQVAGAGLLRLIEGRRIDRDQLVRRRRRAGAECVFG